ncbi:anti-sigma regulatory factor [Streptomyces sp. NPDC055051]|uniref:anti-sigma regulatory factor n=1 Tax=Streptomyces sp. NPDC014861 TaxID=3364923 RepID=UPI0036FD7849
MRQYPADEASREEVAVQASGDVVKARQTVRLLAQQAGLSLVNQTKLVTAASELGRNTLIYGGGGTVQAAIVRDVARVGVWVRFADTGPGIPDMDLALTDGWTSGSGMGLGLSGARRLVDEFELDSTPGVGTTVTVLKWAR